MSNMTSVRYEVRAGWLDDSPLIGWLTYPRENVPEDEEKDSSRSNSARLAVRSPSSTLIETPSFEYSLAWLENGFSLGADLPLISGKQNPLPGMRTFGFVKDRQPSSEAENLLSPLPGEKLPAGYVPGANKSELGAITMPSSAIAYGGLLFYEENAPLAATQPIVALKELPELIYAFHAYERGKSAAEETALLRAASLVADERLVFGILSNRRPITLVFPSVHDGYDVPFWRAFGLKMARLAGIETVDWKLENRLGESILQVDRFDRELPLAENTVKGVYKAPRLLAAASANTLTMRMNPRTDRPQPISYLAMADILNREGASPGEDLPRLWDRLVYTLLTNRGADRPERWQFIRTETGWRPAPAHLLEWTPVGFGGRHRGITLDGRRQLVEADDAVSVAAYFGLRPTDAKMRLMSIRRTLHDWEALALEDGANPSDIGLMASLFD